VHLVDLAPTLAQLTGAPVPHEWVGELLALDPPAEERVLFTPFLTRGQGVRATSLRVGESKYVSFPTHVRIYDEHPAETLFDLAIDPGEHASRLTSDDLERWRALADELWLRYPPTGALEQAELSSETLRQLEELGY
jgi:hypothetical protein